MTSTVKLNIKSASDSEDKELSSTLESTVFDLKKDIESKWPSHPAPKDQRLVYAGKMLENGSLLKDVLRLEDARDKNNAFTIHLVCRIMTAPSPLSDFKPDTEGLRRRKQQPEQQQREPVQEQQSQHSQNPQLSHHLPHVQSFPSALHQHHGGDQVSP